MSSYDDWMLNEWSILSFLFNINHGIIQYNTGSGDTFKYSNCLLLPITNIFLLQIMLLAAPFQY